MQINDNGFIGYADSPKDMLFSGTDSHIRFQTNLKIQGESWSKSFFPLSYKINSFGHRSVEYSDLDFDNYILCTGCSLVEGIGLPVEKRWSDLLASMLNCDMYNLGLGGSGNDIIFFNLLVWLNKFKQQPKLVIIAWSSEERFSTLNNNQINLNLHFPTDKDIFTRNFIVDGSNLNYFNSKTFLYKKLIRSIINVPIIEIPFLQEKLGHDNEVNFDLYKKIIVDRARDLMHPGIQSNINSANEIYNTIKERNLLKNFT